VKHCDKIATKIATTLDIYPQGMVIIPFMTHRTTPLSTLPATARAVSVLVRVLLITTLTAGMGFA